MSDRADDMRDEVLQLGEFADEQFLFTRWPSKTESYGGIRYQGIEPLVTQLMEYAGRVAPKDTLPLFAFAVTSDGQRKASKVTFISGFAFDCDGGADPEPLLRYLDQRGVAYVFYESSSHRYICDHNPYGKACWRIMLPFTKPWSAEDAGRESGFKAFKALRQVVGQHLWTVAGLDLATLDRSTVDPCRGWYPGSRPTEDTAPRRIIYSSGRALNAWAMVERIPTALRLSATASRTIEPTAVVATALDDARLETLVEEFVGAWRELAGKRVRHDGAMALAHALVLGGCLPEDAVEVIREMASRAGDVDEIEFGDRSKTAKYAIERSEGYRLTFLRKNCPDLFSAVVDSEILTFQVNPRLLEDLENNADWNPTPMADVRDQLRVILRSVPPGSVAGVRFPPGAFKTTSAMAEAIERAGKGLRTAVISKTYSLVWGTPVELLQRAGIPFSVLLTTTSKDPEGEYFCRQAGTALKLAEAGFNPRSSICPRCDERATCICYRGFTGDNNGLVTLGVHQMFPEAVQRVGPSGLILIDERVPLYLESTISLQCFVPAMEAVYAVLDPEFQDITRSVISKVSRWAQGAEPGQPVRLADVVDSIEVFLLRQIKVGALSLDPTRPAFVEDAALVGRVLRPLVNAARDPEIWLEVEDRDGTGERSVLVCGRHPVFSSEIEEAPCGIGLLDGSLERPLLQASIRRKPITIEQVQVDDACDVDRVIVQAANTTRGQLLEKSLNATRVRWDLALGPIREVMRLVGENGSFEDPKRVKLLFVSFKVVVEEILSWLDAEAPKKPATAAARAVLDLFLEWRRRGHVVEFEYYLNALGTNDYRDFDCCVSFGDPWINRGAAAREARFSNQDFAETYRQKVREELDQVHGRLRVIVPTRTKYALLIHIGQVAPLDWSLEITTVRRLKIGRPRVAMSSGKVLPTKAEREAAGLTQIEVAKRYGVSLATLKRWERRTR